MSRTAIETALCWLIHARNCADISRRMAIRAMVRHDIQRLRAMH